MVRNTNYTLSVLRTWQSCLHIMHLRSQPAHPSALHSAESTGPVTKSWEGKLDPIIIVDAVLKSQAVMAQL